MAASRLPRRQWLDRIGIRSWILSSVSAAGILLLAGVHDSAIWLLALVWVSVPIERPSAQDLAAAATKSDPCAPSGIPFQIRWAAAASVASIVVFVALLGRRDLIIPSTWPPVARPMLLLIYTAMLVSWGRSKAVLFRAGVLGGKLVAVAALGSFLLISLWADTTIGFQMLRTALLPAMSEELVFRVMLPKLIFASVPTARASTARRLLISAIAAQALFALSHAVVVWRGPKELIRLFAAGLFYEQLVSRGALETAILLHTVTNYIVALGRGQEQPRSWIILACLVVVAYLGLCVGHPPRTALRSRR